MELQPAGVPPMFSFNFRRRGQFTEALRGLSMTALGEAGHSDWGEEPLAQADQSAWLSSCTLIGARRGSALLLEASEGRQWS